MNAANKHGLGRGLGALLGDEDLNLDLDFLDEEKSGVKTVKITKLHAGKDQPRKNFDEEKIQSLVISIQENGVLQPLLVRKDFEGYEIIAGERRFRAAVLAGLDEVPVIEKELSDNKVAEISLIENIVRQDLTDLEEADGFNNMIEKCDLLITHAGTGVIINAVKREKKVIATPRLSKYSEHVDDHQIQLINQFDELKFIEPLYELDNLDKVISNIKKKKYKKYVSNTDNIIESIEAFIS